MTKADRHYYNEIRNEVRKCQPLKVYLPFNPMKLLNTKVLITGKNEGGTFTCGIIISRFAIFPGHFILDFHQPCHGYHYEYFSWHCIDGWKYIAHYDIEQTAKEGVKSNIFESQITSIDFQCFSLLKIFRQVWKSLLTFFNNKN